MLEVLMARFWDNIILLQGFDRNMNSYLIIMSHSEFFLQIFISRYSPNPKVPPSNCSRFYNYNAV